MTRDEAKERVEHIDQQQRVLKRWIRIKSKGYEWADLQDEDVLNVVSKVTGISKRDIRSKKRHAGVVLARNLVMYILNVRMRRTSVASANLVNRDHSTCIHGVNVVKGYVDIYRKHNVDNMNVVANLRECEELLSIRASV